MHVVDFLEVTNSTSNLLERLTRSSPKVVMALVRRIPFGSESDSFETGPQYGVRSDTSIRCSGSSRSSLRRQLRGGTIPVLAVMGFCLSASLVPAPR
jgi:hypothetical protein